MGGVFVSVPAAHSTSLDRVGTEYLRRPARDFVIQTAGRQNLRSCPPGGQGLVRKGTGRPDTKSAGGTNAARVKIEGAE